MNLTPEKENDILSKIFEIRGEKVILDRDLATLYHTETKYLNRIVARNSKRFPERYMFQLTQDEVNILRCQFVTANISSKSRVLPYVFTEYGTLQLSSILNSDIAVEMNHRIIEAFVYLRKQVNVSSEMLTLREKIKRIETEQEAIKLSQLLESKLKDSKLSHMSKALKSFSNLLDEFQNSYVIIKKPFSQNDHDNSIN